MEKKQHPSYGMLQLSRSSIGGNGTALFGSSIMHNDVIRLTISNGFMEREDSQDRYYVKTSRKNCIVEVDMSYTQFAEAVTSLNMGDGVPVTITNIGGQPVPQCPYENKQKMMRKEVEEAADSIARKLNQQAAEVKKLLDEKRVLSKSDREWIVDVLKSAGRRLGSDLPFLNELFQEQMDFRRKCIKQGSHGSHPPHHQKRGGLRRSIPPECYPGDWQLRKGAAAG